MTHQPEHSFVESDGIWRQYRQRDGVVGTREAPVLFLDRDGVLVEEVHYLHRVDDIRIYPAAVRLVQDAKMAGWSVLIVTNQAGIGRGLYGWDDFGRVNSHLLRALESSGACIDGVLAAPHHAEGVGCYRVENHPMRKPNPGMILDGLGRLRASARRSVVVGDRVTDLAAGRAAGWGRGILVRTGYGIGEESGVEGLTSMDFETRVVNDLDQFPREWLMTEREEK